MDALACPMLVIHRARNDPRVLAQRVPKNLVADLEDQKGARISGSCSLRGMKRAAMC